MSNISNMSCIRKEKWMNECEIFRRNMFCMKNEKERKNEWLNEWTSNGRNMLWGMNKEWMNE